MSELPTHLGLPLILADEAVTLEDWRVELAEGDLD